MTIFFTVQLTLDTVSAATTNQSTIVNTVVKNNTTQTSVNSQTKTLVASTQVKSSSPVYISMSQLKIASISVKKYIYTHRQLPSYVTIAKRQVTMPQFLELLTTGVIKIKYGSTSSMPLRTAYSNSNIYETVKNGSISKNEYLNIAKWVKIYMDKNRKAPSLVKTSKGRVNFNTLIFTYSRIVSFYATQKRLPNTANINSWRNIISARPVYITSDGINGSIKDNARINAIVNGLNALGLYAVNWGLGPNTHVQVLKSSQVPPNALIIDIYGGACAGTLYEMGLTWYKSYKSTRKIYSIFWNTQTVITGLTFLRRAHDDSFTPVYGTGSASAFPNFEDVNNNCKFEPGDGFVGGNIYPTKFLEYDGLAHPDDYLHANGYNYFYSSDISAIVSAVYKQAVF